MILGLMLQNVGENCEIRLELTNTIISLYCAHGETW